MSIDEIKKIPIHDICNKNSVLFLWVINKYIFQSYEIAKSWGYKPVTLLTWCKNPMGLGLGGAFVQTSEHLLYCKRGEGLPVLKRYGSSWFIHKRGKHSKKPDFVKDVIVETFGNYPRIELFARNYTNGWDVWGNEVNINTENI